MTTQEEKTVLHTGIDGLTFHNLRTINQIRAGLWSNGNTDRWTLGDWANAMQGEAGEAGNVVKKMRRCETDDDFGTRVFDKATWERYTDMLAEELADVIIYCDLLADKVGINLTDAVRDKFNKVSRREGIPVFVDTDPTKEGAP